MNRPLRLLIGAAGIAGGAARIAREEAPAPRPAACEDQRFPGVASPDGSRYVVMFRRVCGEAVPVRTHVSVLPLHEEPSGTGNVFTMEAPPRRGPGDYDFGVLWMGEDRLLIRYLPSVRVLRAARRVGKVRVEYRDFRAGDGGEPLSPPTFRRNDHAPTHP